MPKVSANKKENSNEYNDADKQDELLSITDLKKELPVAEVAKDTDFTGVARSVEGFLNNGQFQNFRIVTLHIDKGKVTKIEYSDPYASFETIARLELANELSVIHLNNRWEHGKSFEK